MNDLLAQGSTMLGDLRDQREMIKGFRRKLVDIAGVLGMSGTVMRLIERRQGCSFSPQFWIVKSTNASEKWSHIEEGLGDPFSIL